MKERKTNLQVSSMENNEPDFHSIKFIRFNRKKKNHTESGAVYAVLYFRNFHTKKMILNPNARERSSRISLQFFNLD